MIVGMGTDIVEVARVAKLWKENRAGLERRVFTPAEIAYCESRHHPEQHLAARFAAKEAALKAFGTGWAKGLGFQDIEVIRPVERGAPLLKFLGAAVVAAQKLGIHRSNLSMSHTEQFATATVVFEKDSSGVTVP